MIKKSLTGTQKTSQLRNFGPWERLSATRGVHNSDQSSKRGEIGAGILYPENVVVELAKFHSKSTHHKGFLCNIK